MARSGFRRRLDSIERRLASAAGPSGERDDLPGAVSALASRIGVPRRAPPRVVHIGQAGSMRQKPGGAEMRFRARQVIAIAEPAFIWRADFAPFRLVRVADYFVDGTGGLEARILDIIPLLTFVGHDMAAKGEIMRYLAELPWAPDAIRYNRALDWRVLDGKTLSVAAGSGARRGEVRLLLGEDGLVGSVEADDRPRLEGGSAVERPWRGRFRDYREFQGRKIPVSGEVSWLADGAASVYWRGRILRWAAVQAAPT